MKPLPLTVLGLMTLGAVIDELQTDVTNAIATREIFWEAAYTGEIPEAFNNTLEAHGFNLIVAALH